MAATHPVVVTSLPRRIAALLCVLTFAQSAMVQCAGWQTSPEARRQCCREGACARVHQHDGTAAAAVAQTAADACCAQAPQQDKAASASPSGAAVPLGLVSALSRVALPLLPLLTTAPWRAPSPPSRVPRHLLISVLLV